jgi:hypothetical protein
MRKRGKPPNAAFEAFFFLAFVFLLVWDLELEF